jgi:cobalt-precorrin 5A hydrolase
MTGLVAIGVGCRRSCPAEAIEALVREALDRVPLARPLGLFTIADKGREPGLVEAAGRLGLDLLPLSREALNGRAEQIGKRSHRTEARFGVPSVAEAAALAGAGPDSVLVVARIAAGGATCAIAGRRVR